MSRQYLEPNSPYFVGITANAPAMTTYIQAATATIEAYCHRIFSLGDYAEELTTQQDGSVLLSNYPVVSISRLLTDTVAGLTLSNDGATAATASVGVDGVRLVRVAAGVTSSSTIALEDVATLDDLADAINALDNGWEATTGVYGQNPAADLVTGQVASVRQSGSLRLWVDTTTYYHVDPDTGIVCGGWCRGSKVKAIYSAGFESVPEPVLLSVAELVKNWFMDGQLYKTAENFGIYSYAAAEKSMQHIPLPLRAALNLYRDRRV